MKRTRYFLLVPIVGVTLGFATPSPLSLAQSSSEQADKSVLDRVTAAPVTRKNMKWTTTQPGRIVADEETQIASKLSGFVESVLVDIGDEVKKNQILMRLSIPEMADELKQKEALLVQAEAEVQQAESAVNAAKAALETAASGIDEAQAGKARVTAELQRVKAEHTRIQQLASTGAVTTKLADETLSQLRAVEASGMEVDAKVKSAEAHRRQADANVQKMKADVEAAVARQAVATANRGHVRTMMHYLEIKAPFDGVVTQRAVDTGHFVQPAHSNASPLLVIAKTEKLRVSIEVPEMEASSVDAGEKGDAVVITVQSFNKKPIEGRITRTAWGLDSTNRSLRTEVDIVNKDKLLRPGMYASATITLDQRTDVVVLPITAILRKDETTHCCVVKDGKIEIRPIELGLRSGAEVEIVSGLQAGEIVVMARGDALVQGQSVVVIAPPAPK
ncbi:MAG: efflux RND transporter periplasmic adaptor subunit [Pirellulaceae bacterium]|nr:efflux RND transporter periplasmic adaptor subunit [Pirellulaceae bacterium]